MDIHQDIIEKAKGLILKPSETFETLKSGTFEKAFVYFLILLLVCSAIASVIYGVAFSMIPFNYPQSYSYPTTMMRPAPVTVISPIIGVMIAVIFFIFSLIGGIIGVFIGGLWFHLWVYVMGGRKGVMQTIVAYMYSSTPNFLFGWIFPVFMLLPLIAGAANPAFVLVSMLALVVYVIVLAVWGLILLVKGIRIFHEISTGNAIAAVLVAIVIPVVIVVAIVIFMVMIIMTLPFHGNWTMMQSPGFYN
jgi:hypothetical protein